MMNHHTDPLPPTTRPAAASAAPTHAWLRGAVLGATLLLAGGCIVERPARVVYTEPAPIVVTEAPPAPFVETVPVAPGPDYIWVRGHWHWEGRRWVWNRGHYARPPHRGAVWIAPRYETRAGGSVYISGFWR